MGEEKPSYFGIIPATVRYDKSLKANAKLLYSELTCLSEKDGYCYASNNYFAKLYEVDPSSISKWLKQLADKGYIKIEYKYNGKECTERKIFINTNAKGSAENQEGIDICQGVLPNCQEGIDIRQEGYCQIAKENNTSVNNTSINNINLPEETKKKRKPTEPKIKFGEYQNVLLTLKEYDNFVSKYGKDKTDAFIQHFSELKEMKGYKYKSDNLALKNWGISAFEEYSRKNNPSQKKSNWYDSKNIGKAESDRFTENVNESDIPF